MHRGPWWIALGVALMLITVGCRTAPATQPPSVATPTPPALSPAELKYLVIAHLGGVFFCDSDYYPVARPDGERQRAQEVFPQIQEDHSLFEAIRRHLGLAVATSYADDQKLEVYQEYKRLNAVELESAGNAYSFRLRTQTSKGEGFVVEGEVTSGGQVRALKREPTITTCPICLSENTRIDTPNGWVPIPQLHVGTMVWTMDATGDRVVAPIVAVGSTPVPVSHEVVRIRLGDGRELVASPRHPTVNGRFVGDLVLGDILDGSPVVSVEREPYRGAATYDIMPAGATGWYWANGILVASTLAPKGS